MSLTVHDLHHQFPNGDRPLLDAVSFQVVPGSVTCPLGPSGIGKTTVLHMIAGLVHPDRGTISFDGTSIDHLPAHRRPFTLLMQQPHLFANLDVLDNVAFGLRVRGVGRRERRRQAHHWLELVGINHLAHRSTIQLSGGEQQRVALARALAVEPKVLLADEPFASVDPTARRELQDLVAVVHREIGTTILLVTHDHDEAARIADHWLHLDANGVTVQVPHAPA